MHVFKGVLTIIFLSGFYLSSIAQTTTTVVPFLNLVPDARAGAMGDAGVALPPDANSISINAAKLPFMNQRFGFSISYSPWLKSLVPDMNLGYLSAYLKPDENSSISASMRYFSLGTIQFTGLDEQDLGSYRPMQLALDAAYSRKLSPHFAIGTAFRYIVTNGDTPSNQGAEPSPPIKAISADVSAYFVSPVILFGSDARFSAGLNLSNIARAIQFKSDPNKYYLPTNLKFGVAACFQLDDLSQFSFAVDINELLNPVQYTNLASNEQINHTPPGLQKIIIGTGLEYMYNNRFALRTGYSYENPNLGNQRFFSFGPGFKFNSLNLDISYLAANVQKSPLANSLRFTLMFTFAGD